MFERLRKLPGPVRAAVLLMGTGAVCLALSAVAGDLKGEVRLHMGTRLAQTGGGPRDRTPAIVDALGARPAALASAPPPAPGTLRGLEQGSLPSVSAPAPAPAPAPAQAAVPATASGDVLDRIRAARTPALEQEILEIARSSIAAAVAGYGAEERCHAAGPQARAPGGRPPDSRQADAILAAPAGVFVALILDGRVRGCMGTVYPMEASLAEEIASAARMAATSDPRRLPVRPEEVARLEYCVSVVGRVRRHDPAVPVNPRIQGVIVRANGRAGVILPGEARTGAYEMAWAKREAGVGPGEHYELYVFETERFGKALPLRR
ncbi:MAG: AMMECR1 domain-containing protein [Bacillota bacterium]|nr:AMMECR1 domain-containing protein [Bacillota bacterium]